MNQNALNRAVARATGESIACIARLGFSLVGTADYIEPASAVVRRSWKPRRRQQGRATTVRLAR